MYHIWHRDEKILSIVDTDVIVHLPEKLPFDLKSYNPITYREYLAWLNRRLNNLQRTYMNRLYMQRRIGRSHTDIINDSAAISITDQFWVTRDGLAHTWDSLQVLRDESLVIVDVCLEGKVNLKGMYKTKTDHTSVFSLKGAFEKAPYKGFLIKKGNNAEYEISAYHLGRHLGISVAEAQAWEDGKVTCRIFTDDNTSLVHALELLYTFDALNHDDRYIRALDAFASNANLTKQLQRLFLFYLTDLQKTDVLLRANYILSLVN